MYQIFINRAEINNDKANEREQNRAKKAQEEAEKEERRNARLEKEREAETKGIERCATLMVEIEQKGCDHIRTLNVSVLKDLIRYHFKSEMRTSTMRNSA